MTAELARYDAMCRAIDEAYQIDEVKDIRDKALALEVYSRQAKNIEAERRACEIRLRAERKAGELRRQEEKSKGAAAPSVPPKGGGVPLRMMSGARNLASPKSRTSAGKSWRRSRRKISRPHSRSRACRPQAASSRSLRKRDQSPWTAPPYGFGAA